jgi:hypothetical protein
VVDVIDAASSGVSITTSNSQSLHQPEAEPLRRLTIMVCFSSKAISVRLFFNLIVQDQSMTNQLETFQRRFGFDKIKGDLIS